MKQELLGIYDLMTSKECCYVAYCITIHKAQGLSYDHAYTIHEWHKLDARLKYVALSRCTKLEYINIM